MRFIVISVSILLFFAQVKAAEIGLHSTSTTADIIVSGEITPGDANKVHDLIDRIDGDKKIHRFIIHSPGGNVTEAISIGSLLRSYGFTVFEPVGVTCISACIFAIAGGRSRILMGKVALHHPYLPHVLESHPVARQIQSEGKQAMLEYMKKMGVQETIVDAMYSLQDPSEIKYLSTAELQAYKLATDQ